MKQRYFVGLDGEGYTDASGHRYVLIASSTGHYRYNAEGLSTADCFQFLLNMRKQSRSYIFVGFGFNYDVNMFLRDLGRAKLETLWREHRVTWYSYQIEWIPGKWFRLSDGEATIRVYDVFGFFQASFIKALQAWDIPPLPDLEEMKAKRSAFDESMRDEIIEYCIGECRKLVELMDALRDALDSVDLVPSSWIGAGSIASALMQSNGVRAHHSYDNEYPPDVQHAILGSYFGGRVELFQQGTFPRVTDYDVVSAYPSCALSLPSLVGAKWQHVTKFVPNNLYGIYKVRWEIESSDIVMPFPFRYKRGIYYPLQGTGYYHAPEVAQAINAYGKRICVLDGYVLRPSTDSRPFSFVRRAYADRLAFRQRGHPGYKILKLGLNAIYGKLAQGYGFRGKPPAYQSYYWAGLITSMTRARLFAIARMAPERLIMVATDGIFFDQPAPTLKESKQLGGVESSVFTDLFVAQAGVYHGWHDGEEVRKSRGFFAREIDFNQLRDGFASEGPTFVGQYPSRRFVGLGAALMRRDLTLWRQWHDSTRELSLYPSRKFVGASSGDGMPIRHTPPAFGLDTVSELYTPKDDSLTWAEELLDFLSGMEQPTVGGLQQ